MHRTPFQRRLACALAVALAGVAQAQTPELAYQSVFVGYQKYKDQPVTSWAASNVTVEKIGGWRVYAREAQRPDPKQSTTPEPMPTAAPASMPSPAAVPKPVDHTGHGGRR